MLSPFITAVLTPLDGSSTPPPGEAHWRWAVWQMELTPEQVGAWGGQGRGRRAPLLRAR